VRARSSEVSSATVIVIASARKNAPLTPVIAINGKKTADPPSSGASTFNVASGESYSVLEIADKVARRWTALHPESVPPKIDVVPNPREGVELVEPEFSVSRALTEQRLGLKCQRTVDGSLDELLASTRDPRR